ncbi:MAG TPA: septal ring lytic transglycosylase RlpA family protein [Terriglobia bacterium]|nr:septal ring lytic transglycosylase RlpA family protein [Terriglobia bacterium]
MRNLVIGCAVAALVAMSARSEARPPELKMLMASPSSAARSQYGVASWYGQECQGSPTASGALFNMNALTCAHRELPLGTKVKVTNLLNHRTLDLKVTDRGPAVSSRVLDVSMVAAKRLGFLQAGLTPVRIQVLRYPHSFLTGQAFLKPVQSSLN